MQLQDISLLNLGTVNKNRVSIKSNLGTVHLYFSYQTLVGFINTSGEVFCRENEWGPTTGKLLKEIEPDKKKRLNSEDFMRLVSRYGIC